MTKEQLVKTALKARKKESNEHVSSAEETSEDKGKSLPMAGENSAQGLPNPKKPAAAAANAGEGKAPFNPDLVKYKKGKAGKSPVQPAKRAAGAVFWPKAKTR